MSQAGGAHTTGVDRGGWEKKKGKEGNRRASSSWSRKGGRSAAKQYETGPSSRRDRESLETIIVAKKSRSNQQRSRREECVCLW